jgi:transposase
LKELSARLTVLKNEPETAWLRQLDSQLLQQVLADLYRAFSNYFERRACYPRLTSRKRDRARFRIPQRVRVVGHVVQIPKVGRVRLRLSRPVQGQTKSATFTQDATGHWYDLNAAVNIKKEGLRLLAVGHTESLNACGADVRPASCWQIASKQESHVL